MTSFRVELKSEFDVQPWVYKDICDEKGLQNILDLGKKKKFINIEIEIKSIAVFLVVLNSMQSIYGFLCYTLQL